MLLAGSYPESSYKFKFHENRQRDLGAVEGRKSPLRIDLAHGLYNSLYYRTSRDITNRAGNTGTDHPRTPDRGSPRR